MPSCTEAYDLLDCPFAEVTFTDGRGGMLGILDLLRRAQDIRDIRHANPQEDLAVFRFLFALLQWVRPDLPPAEREQIREAGALPSDLVAAVAERAAGRFHLLGDGPRLYQSAPAAVKPNRPTSDLFSEIPAATEINHFRHVYDDSAAFCAACCARGLLRMPAFCLQGGQGKSPSINDTPPVYFLPVGATLLHTLLLNWPMPKTPGDRPAWEGEGDGQAVGVLEGLTWQPRQIRLGKPAEQAGAQCVLCGVTGAQRPILRDMVCLKGRKYADRSRAWRDPHVAYQPARTKGVTDTPALEPLRTPGALSHPGAAARHWRRVAAALLQSVASTAEQSPILAVKEAAARREPGEPLRARVFLAATRQAKTFDVGARDWFLADGVLSGPGVPQALLGELDHLQTAGRDLERAWLRALAEAKPKRADVFRGRVAWHLTVFEEALSRRFAELLGQWPPGGAPEETMAGWRRKVQKDVSALVDNPGMIDANPIHAERARRQLHFVVGKHFQPKEAGT